jgi:polysaccharide export outer membrane protein
LTKTAAEKLIREQLRPYLKETPIVTVRMSNYKISVIGEVNRPGTFTINNEKVNLFEALAMAGDMTVYGIRSNVNGQRNIISLNLNEQNILHSPYYYLQQNDILYVTPNKTKAKNASISNSTTIWFSVVGTLVSLASLIVTIAR